MFAQSRFAFGVEAGINCSGFPNEQNKMVSTQNNQSKETNMPVIYPLIGLWASVNFGKHFYGNLGMQYFKVGDKYHKHLDGNDVLYNETYSYDKWENQLFNRISIPFSFAYKLKIRNFKSNIFAGIRASYYTKGSYYSKIEFIEKNHPSNVDRIQELNPFNKSDFSYTARKWNYGFLAGINFGITKNLNLELSWSLDEVILYGNGFNDEGYFNIYDNNDLAMTIKYRFHK